MRGPLILLLLGSLLISLGIWASWEIELERRKCEARGEIGTDNPLQLQEWCRAQVWEGRGDE